MSPRSASIATASLMPCCGWRVIRAGRPCSRSTPIARRRRASGLRASRSRFSRKDEAISAAACSVCSRHLPPGPVIIVGSDIPAIRAEHIAAAFKLLGRADAVFGQAPDGGYWLIGLKRSPRVLQPFADIRWSGPHALADTLANLDGKSVASAATLSDVDTAENFRHERAHAQRLVSPSKRRTDNAFNLNLRGLI